MSNRNFRESLIRLIDAMGPISIGQYIAESNAHYYAHHDPLGQGGDFVTAPEISQTFGEIIGLALTAKWQEIAAPKNATYAEMGPGRGTLASDALRIMARAGWNADVHFIEASPVLRKGQAKAVSNAKWHQDVSTLPEAAPIFLVANEFFDALPVRQLVRTDAGWREVMVANDGQRLLPVPGTQSMDTAIPIELASAPEGTLIETSPAAQAVMKELAGKLTRTGGMALIFDYGEERPLPGSSLQAVRNHVKVDAFEQPGEADLTTHVNFGDLMEIARHAGCTARLFGQGDWLKANGIIDRTRQLVSASPLRRNELVSALRRLVDPEEMGQLFKCLVILPDPRK